MMEELLEIHERFVRDTIALNKYSDSVTSLVPSFIFIFSNFFIIYRFCHRYTRIGFTTCKAWLFRELTFHWSFFYLCKMWFLFMKTFKISMSYLCEHLANDESYSSCHLSGLIILMFISTLPTVIFVIRRCTRHTIPNFLMWVGEDPWLRTEIGSAGHYLDRPPRFRLPPRQECSYRTRRSSSAEETTRKGTFLRVSKSLETSKCTRPIKLL